MRRYATVYYLLFVLIIMGAFASMAQNAYGLKICGIACLGFAATFLHEIFFATHENEPVLSGRIRYLELISLSVIALLFFGRNFSVDFSFSTTLLIGAVTILLLILSYQAAQQIRIFSIHNRKHLVAIVLYYCAVITFILAFLMGLVLPEFANKLAVFAMLITIGFVAVSLAIKSFNINDEVVSIWSYIGQLKNKSAILLISCLLLFAYSLLYSGGALPALYQGEFPKGYQQLVESGIKNNDLEKPREFKERYEEFLRRHGKN